MKKGTLEEITKERFLNKNRCGVWRTSSIMKTKPHWVLSIEERGRSIENVAYVGFSPTNTNTHFYLLPLSQSITSRKE